MVQMQIIEQPGANLHAELVAAMRSGAFKHSDAVGNRCV
jgi:hypothetical protein